MGQYDDINIKRETGHSFYVLAQKQFFGIRLKYMYY
jgi:hypothetical protein